MVKYDITTFLSSLKDPRRKQGQRHSFENIITIILMAILSGHQGIRGFDRFAKANAKELTLVFKLKYGVPSYSTFQALITELDEQLLVSKFIDWIKKNFPQSADDFIALDGKAIRATVKNGCTKLQTFVAVVNAFGHQSELVYGMKFYQNSKSGEPAALRELVEQLGLKDKIFTMDALHTQKKHLT